MRQGSRPSTRRGVFETRLVREGPERQACLAIQMPGVMLFQFCQTQFQVYVSCLLLRLFLDELSSPIGR